MVLVSRQRGLIWWAYLAIGLILFGVGSAGVILYTNAIKGKEKAESELRITNDLLESKMEEVADLQLEKEELDKQLVVRQGVSNVIVKQSRDESNAIQQAKNEDITAANWATTPIPDTILNRLRDTDKSKDRDTKTTGTKDMAGETRDRRVEQSEDKNE